MTDKAIVPAHIAAMLQGSNITTTDDMDIGSGGASRISLKGSKFLLKSDGEEIKLGAELFGVIVGITPHTGFTKTYYEAGYTPNSSDAPDCSSSDGIRPDSYISNPINNVCRSCPKNQWGSATSMSGKKAKACKDSKRLHVVIAEDLGKPDPIVYILVVTVLSLKPFGDYGKRLIKDGVPTSAVIITKFSFDEETSVPKLVFENAGYLDEKNCRKAIEVAAEKSWDPAPTSAAKIEAPKVTTEVKEASNDVSNPLDNW